MPSSCRRFRFTDKGVEAVDSAPIPHPINGLSHPAPTQAAVGQLEARCRELEDARAKAHASWLQELSSSSLLTAQLNAQLAQVRGLEGQLASVQAARDFLDDLSTQQAGELTALREALDGERRRYEELSAQLNERIQRAEELRVAAEQRTATAQAAMGETAVLRARLAQAEAEQRRAVEEHAARDAQRISELEQLRLRHDVVEADNARLLTTTADLQQRLATLTTPSTPSPSPPALSGPVPERVRRLQEVHAQLTEMRQSLTHRLAMARQSRVRSALQGELEASARDIDGLLRENEETLAVVARGRRRCPGCGEAHCGGVGGGEDGELMRANRELRDEVERLRKGLAAAGARVGEKRAREDRDKENVLTPIKETTTSRRDVENQPPVSGIDKRRKSAGAARRP